MGHKKLIKGEAKSTKLKFFNFLSLLNFFNSIQ